MTTLPLSSGTLTQQRLLQSSHWTPAPTWGILPLLPPLSKMSCCSFNGNSGIRTSSMNKKQGQWTVILEKHWQRRISTKHEAKQRYWKEILKYQRQPEYESGRKLSWAQTQHILWWDSLCADAKSEAATLSPTSGCSLSPSPDYLWFTNVHSLYLWATLWLELCTINLAQSWLLLYPQIPNIASQTTTSLTLHPHTPSTSFIISHAVLFTQSHCSLVWFLCLFLS